VRNCSVRFISDYQCYTWPSRIVLAPIHALHFLILCTVMRISLAYGVQTQCSGLCRPFSLLRTQGQTFCRLVAGHEPRRVLWFYTACTWKNGSCVLKMTYVYYYFFLFIPLVTPLFWLHPVTTVFYVLTNLPILWYGISQIHRRV
jgi:hypothetical protein